MFTFLLVVHAIIAAALVAVILMQRSEGGGLGMGGSPTGLMSARGAADFLTRATTILATLFVVMSIGLAVLASVQHGPRKIDTSLSRAPGAAGGLAPGAPPIGSTVPLAGDPLAGIAASAGNVVAPAAPVLPGAPLGSARAPATTAAPAASAPAGRPAPATPATARPNRTSPAA
ncbi:MAG: preprotein translocase subunit SecG, partial [Sphingomonas bacterium]